jgi:TatD DNase family protein
MLLRLVDLGFYISFAGPLTYKKNDSLREACQACPRDRLLLETDAPFLPPQSVRGKRNESSYLIETAQVAAELHRLSLGEMGDLTSTNARAAFGLC